MTHPIPRTPRFHLEGDTLYVDGSNPGSQPTDALLEWLRAHDIDVTRLPATGQQITRGDTWIEVVEGLHDADGNRMRVGEGLELRWSTHVVRHELGRTPAAWPDEVAQAGGTEVHVCPTCGATHIVAGKEA